MDLLQSASTRLFAAPIRISSHSRIAAALVNSGSFASIPDTPSWFRNLARRALLTELRSGNTSANSRCVLASTTLSAGEADEHYNRDVDQVQRSEEGCVGGFGAFGINLNPPGGGTSKCRQYEY